MKDMFRVLAGTDLLPRCNILASIQRFRHGFGVENVLRARSARNSATFLSGEDDVNQRNASSVQWPPVSQGMYDPANEHDACGLGFIAHIKGQKSHAIVD